MLILHGSQSGNLVKALPCISFVRLIKIRTMPCIRHSCFLGGEINLKLISLTDTSIPNCNIRTYVSGAGVRWGTMQCYCYTDEPSTSVA